MATATLKQREIDDLDWFDDETNALVEIPPSAHTLDGFREWALSDELPEKLRVTYIQGKVLLEMSKEDIDHHALVKTEVGRVVANSIVDVDFGHMFINGVLVVNRKAKVCNNPDGVAVSWSSLESKRVRYVRRRRRFVEVVGSPDWIMEIVSDSSVKKDTQTLRKTYHRAGIREYWLIDARGPEIKFQILLWRKAGYVAAAVADGWGRSEVFDRSFRMTRRRDRSGRWAYRLDVK